jgi:hypothetical protein
MEAMEGGGIGQEMARCERRKGIDFPGRTSGGDGCERR